MKRLFTVRTWVALAVAVVVVTAATAYAAIPGGGGTIAACYGRNSGAVRVIDAEAGKQCLPSENALTWTTGRPGAAPPPVRLRVGTAF